MWTDYAKATPNQQEDFRRVNPKLSHGWTNYQIWVTRDGHASLRRGHWQFSAKYGKEMDDAMRAEMRGEGVRSKGDLRGFKTGTLHTSRD